MSEMTKTALRLASLETFGISPALGISQLIQKLPITKSYVKLLQMTKTVNHTAHESKTNYVYWYLRMNVCGVMIVYYESAQ